MDPLQAMMASWGRIQWLFTVWIPGWWHAVEADLNYLRNIGD